MEALKTELLSKSFGRLQVLKGCSLSVEAGEYVAIIGPNGAGKTTLLNLITGELPATSGRIYMLGQEITTMPVYRRICLGLARSFQITRLFFYQTVLNNILLAIRGTKHSHYQMFHPAMAPGEVLDKAQELLERIDLWPRRDELTQAISYGEQRKLEIALSLASKPKVLLMDEPSCGLASAEIPDIINTIKTLARDTTIVFAAHDMDVVSSLADRVIVLNFGQIVAQGTFEEMEANPVVKEIYLGVKDGAANAGTS